MLGLGCMRLSTSRNRDDQRAVAVIRAALAAGVTLLDTAISYCFDDTDRGHNERLIARAIAEWGAIGQRSCSPPRAAACPVPSLAPGLSCHKQGCRRRIACMRGGFAKLTMVTSP